MLNFIFGPPETKDELTDIVEQTLEDYELFELIDFGNIFLINL